MSNQPIWRLAWSSDCERLRIDTTGVYSPELDILLDLWDAGGIGEEDSPDRMHVYTISCDRCTYENGVLSDNPYHPDHPAWFADDSGQWERKHNWNKLHQCARSCGISWAELVTQLCSADPRDRALGYRELAAYFGEDNFDGYPLRMSESELSEWWDHGRIGDMSKT